MSEEEGAKHRRAVGGMSKAEEERLKNQGNAALFNVANVGLERAGENKWRFAAAALLLAVRGARAAAKDSVGMVVLHALEKAGEEWEALERLNGELFEACAAVFVGAKDAGRALVFPALMLAARGAHESADDAPAVIERALRAAKKQVGLP